MIDPRAFFERTLSDLLSLAESLGASVPLALKRKLDALKKVSAIVGDYEVDLTEAVVSFFNGEASLSKVRKVFSKSPREYARDVYLEGMGEGGLTEEDLDEDDERVIEEWIDTQAEHVDGLVEFVSSAKTVDETERRDRQKSILDRVALWVKELRDLGGRGRLRAKDGELAIWELGDTEDHCRDCLANSRLKPKRVKWWRETRGLPRAKDLACHGFNCDCTLRSPKTGRQLYP